jgi:hypothetical protein
MVYGAVCLARVEREDEKNAIIQRGWYGKKDCVSFFDSLGKTSANSYRAKESMPCRLPASTVQ